MKKEDRCTLSGSVAEGYARPIGQVKAMFEGSRM
jgi:hypothetical protein